MQGFNRYYPPDYDPKQNPTLNSISGKHALGDRARKIDKGILVVRFELPFNIWCGGCNNHIGQGVRYNAEKRKVGNYYSTPIFAFRCKCHLCSHWFEIRTDPQNTRYVIEEGAKQRVEEYDPAEAGTFVLDQKDPDKPVDPMAAAEKSAIDKQVAETAKGRLQALASLQEDRWSDPYALSKKLRSSLRGEKRVIQAREESDAALRSKLSLPQDLELAEVNEELRQEAKQQWDEARSQSKRQKMAEQDDAVRKRRRISEGSPAQASSSRLSLPSSSTSTAAKDSLASKLLQSTRGKRRNSSSAGGGGIFDSSSSASSSSTLRRSKSLSGIAKLSKS